MTFNPDDFRKKVTVDVGGRTMTFETGWLAKQAAGSVLVTYGDSHVLVTCQNAKPRGGIDFFPMTIEYREKTGAAGKIPGGFFKREGRPTTKEILTCRLIDRPNRPLFAKGYMQEVQIICSVFSADQEHDPDVCGMNGAPLSAMLAGLPYDGPSASVRVGLKDDKLIINPTYDERKDADLEMIVAGTLNAITMVEAGANEISEDKVLEALELAHGVIKDICKVQQEMVDLVAPRQIEWEAPTAPADDIATECQEFYSAFREAVKIRPKHERKDALKEIKESAYAKLLVAPKNPSDADAAAFAARTEAVKEVIGGYSYKAIRDTIVEDNVRIDGRAMDEVRDIHCDVKPFPRTHGSTIFTRGETQAYVNCTLGTARDQQLIEGLDEKRDERFLLHYNFPPFCTGEAKFLRSASRREIGHGVLAERALRPLLPSEDDFPYTIRIVSDVLESNGSSSMATVCGGTLAMMDAGVPMERQVAGIAMGLIKEGDTVRVLSDILGDEDHCGDMDFKVCGTENGITALQMDIKVAGLSKDIMQTALGQARDGRLHILGVMKEALPESREDISSYAPRYEAHRVPVDAIGMVIGPGGKHIRALQEETNSVITIEDDGMVKIFSEDGAGALKAKEIIIEMTRVIEVGEYVEGPVTSIKDFGVFVQVKAGTEGMCHVSELSDQYVDSPFDVVQMGDVRKYKVINVEQATGKIKLSAKAVILEDRGEEYIPAPPRGGRGGPPRGGRGGPRRDDRRPPRR